MTWGSQSTIVNPPEPRSRRLPAVHRAACAFGAAGCLFSATNTVFTTLDSYALGTVRPRRNSFWWLAVAASCANFLSLVCLAAVLIHFIRHRFEVSRSHHWTKWGSITVIALTFLASSAFSLATFVIKATDAALKDSSLLDHAQPVFGSARGYLPAEFVLLGASIVAQCLFYVLSLRKITVPEQPRSQSSDPEAFDKIRESMITQARQANIMMSFNISTGPSTYPNRSPFHSPAHSLVSLTSIKSPSLSSLKSPRPATSQSFQATRILRRKAELENRTGSPQLDPPQEDGFDTWDTSSVDQQTRDAVMGTPRLTTTTTRLEPIPGSRSTSPIEAEFNLADGAVTPSSYSGHARSLTDSILEPPAPLFATPSRPTTPSGGDESLIHPLFRSESPGPLPRVTPATVITASPMSGQTIPAFTRPNLRSRSQSQPVHPAMTTPERPGSAPYRTASPSPRVRPSPSTPQLGASPMSSG